MTSFLDRLLGRPEPPAPKTAKAVTSLGAWGTGIPLSSMAATPQAKAEAYLKAYKVGWFYKAGRKLADDIASLDWSLSDGDMEEGEEETVLPRPDLSIPFASLSPVDQLQRLLERPNPYQTGRQLTRKTQVRLDFAGAAAWYLAGGSMGLPSAIYGISPARMWPSYAKDGTLVGWVMDKDSASGGVPFDVSEILWFSTGNADNDDIWGTSVVEAVYSQVPLTDLMARHTANVLTTGGRLAGMLWPKERALGEDEFLDAQRAWRNVSSDPDAGKRLLIFPEPMEYAAGASTPAEIGIPELGLLNRDEILTAFPVSPYRLGVPMPGGLNSGEVRREDRRDYWEESVHPRADLLEEVIQVGLVSRYEAATGLTLDFEIQEPNLDDAPTLMEKTAAFKGLISIGIDPKEGLEAVGLAHIKWLGLPDLLDPAKQAEAAAAAQEAKQTGDGSRAVVGDGNRQDNTATQQTIVGKAVKAREDVARTHTGDIEAFLSAQRSRVVARLRETLPGSKSARLSYIKADPEWFDTQTENELLSATMRTVYSASGRASLQVVADSLSRIVPNKAVDRIVADLMEYGGERIRDINARTLQSITIELAEGARRGYSITQLIDGVPSEGFKGVLNVGMENGVGVWGDARAETIARTETALSYNRAALDAYKEFRVARVLAYDGDGDPECAARNGREFSVDDAFSIADHPNGTLDWAPVVDQRKSYDLPEPVAPVTNVHISIPETHVTSEAPVVHVTNDVKTPTVNVTNESPAVTVLNDVHTPSVHVTNDVKTPSVRVTNDVASPQVYVTNEVTTPDVTVNVPKQTAPVINVKAADAPVVNVTTPDTLRITSMPARMTRRKVTERTPKGSIAETIDVEEDIS